MPSVIKDSARPDVTTAVSHVIHAEHSSDVTPRELSCLCVKLIADVLSIQLSENSVLHVDIRNVSGKNNAMEFRSTGFTTKT